MDSKTFVQNAIKTESVPTTVAVSFDTVVVAMEIAIAAGNIVDYIKKSIFYGKEISDGGLALDLARLSAFTEVMGRMNINGHLFMDDPIEIGSEPVDVRDIRVLHGALGMFTESAEMVEALKKYVTAVSDGSENDLDIVNLGEEIGDSDWYKAILHSALGIPEEQIRETVVAKLRKRYRDKFDANAAINRDLEGERKVLEEGITQ